MKKIIFVLSLILIGFTTQSQEVVKNKNAKVSCKVDGVCGMCKKRIETAALKTKGVKFAVWSTKTHNLNLIIDERKTDLAQVQQNILKVGHDIILNEDKKLEAKLEALEPNSALKLLSRYNFTAFCANCLHKYWLLSLGSCKSNMSKDFW